MANMTLLLFRYRSLMSNESKVKNQIQVIITSWISSKIIYLMTYDPTLSSTAAEDFWAK